jgi:hypothetical protein
MINPCAGFAMASRSVAVRRGGRNPFVVLLNSKTEEALAEEVPIPTWAMDRVLSDNARIVIIFFIFYCFRRFYS